VLFQNRLDVYLGLITCHVVAGTAERAAINDYGRCVLPWALDYGAGAGADVQEVYSELVRLAVS